MADSEVKNWCFVSSTGSVDSDSDGKSATEILPEINIEGGEKNETNSEGFDITTKLTDTVKDNDSDLDSLTSEVDIIEENDDAFLKMSYLPSQEDLVIHPPDCFEQDLVILPPNEPNHVVCQTKINMKDGFCCWMIFDPTFQFLIRQIAGLFFVSLIACTAMLMSQFFYMTMEVKTNPFMYRDLLHSTLECIGEQHLEALRTNDADLLHSRICKDKTKKYLPIFKTLITRPLRFRRGDLFLFDLPEHEEDAVLMEIHLPLLKAQLHYFGLLPRSYNPFVSAYYDEEDEYEEIKERQKMINTTKFFNEQHFVNMMAARIRNLTDIGITEHDDIKNEAEAKSLNESIESYKLKHKYQVLKEISSLVRNYQANISASIDFPDSIDGVHLKNIQLAIENLTSTNQKLLREIHDKNVVMNQNLPNQIPAYHNFGKYLESYEDGKEELKDGILSLFLENEKMRKQLKKHQFSADGENVDSQQHKGNDNKGTYNGFDELIPESLFAILNLTRQIAFLQGSVNNDIIEVKKFFENVTKLMNKPPTQHTDNELWSSLQRLFTSADQNTSSQTEQRGPWQVVYSWQGMMNLWQDIQSNLTEKVNEFENGKMAETFNTYVEGTKRNAERMLNKVNDYFATAQNRTMEILDKSKDSSSMKTVWNFLGNLKESMSHVTGEVKDAVSKMFDPETSCPKAPKKDQEKVRIQRVDWLFERAAIRAKWRERQQTNNWYLELMKIRKKLRKEKLEHGI